MKRTMVWSLFVALVAFLVLAGKFGYIQLIQSDALQKEAVDLRVRQIKELPERGQVFDQNGKIMAMSLNAKDIAVYPNLISKKREEEVARILSQELASVGVTYQEVLQKIRAKGENKKKTPWQGIARRVEPEVAKRIKESDISGVVEISNSPKRYYPNGTVASSLLGYVNHNNEPGAGIELKLNSYLSGTPGYTLAEMDYMKRQIPIGFQTVSSPVEGQKVTLTIDSYIQYVLEDRIKEAMKSMKAKEIHAVIMNPTSGEIVAMASAPSFNPNEYTAFPQDTHNRNAASYVYEPGSTFKPVYMAQALDKGYISPDFSYYDGGRISVGGASIKNWDGKGLGQAGLEDIIVNSSNVGMINISMKMNANQVVENLADAGFGKKTGIELPNEEVGIIRDSSYIHNDPQMKATISFGQGLSVTPIQLATAFSEIVNGGYDVTPTLVKKIEDGFGNITYHEPEAKRDRVYKEDTARHMKEYLKANMVKGSGKDVQIDGYDGGGKTGSAWKVENNRYKSGAIVGSFMGFIPFDQPEYVMLAVVDEPKGIEFGSLSGGPLFKDVMTEVSRYRAMNKTVPMKGKDTVEVAKELTVPNVEFFVYDDAKRLLEEKLGRVVVSRKGSGSVVVEQTYRMRGNLLYVDLKMEHVKGDPYTYIPYIGGKSEKEVKEIFANSPVRVVVHGKGHVASQSVSPGTYSKPLSKISIWLK